MLLHIMDSYGRPCLVETDAIVYACRVKPSGGGKEYTHIDFGMDTSISVSPSPEEISALMWEAGAEQESEYTYEVDYEEPDEDE